MQYSRVPSALRKHFTVMNEGKLCTHASKKVMLLKPSQISELILAMTVRSTRLTLRQWQRNGGYEEVKNDSLVHHTSTV